MKKGFLFFTVIMVFTLFLVPQSADAIGPKLGFGVEASLPQGDFGDVAETGFGGYGRVEMGMVVPGLSMTLSGGYLQHGAKEFDFPDVGGIPVDADVDVKITMIPIQAGIKYSLPMVGLYAFGEAGVHFIGWEYEVNGETGLIPYDLDDETYTKFSFAPGVGYERPLGPGLKLDLSVKYQTVSGENEVEFNYLSVRGGVVLGI